MIYRSGLWRRGRGECCHFTLSTWIFETTQPPFKVLHRYRFTSLLHPKSCIPLSPQMPYLSIRDMAFLLSSLILNVNRMNSQERLGRIMDRYCTNRFKWTALCCLPGLLQTPCLLIFHGYTSLYFSQLCLWWCEFLLFLCSLQRFTH